MAGTDTIDLTAHVSKYQAPVAALCAFDVREEETFAALPLLNGVNQLVNGFKEGINNGERGISFKKLGCYLGFRLVTYSGISSALNILSLILSAALCIITLPTRCCTSSINRWCFVRFQGSLGYTLQSIWDIFYDLEQLLCCRPCR